MQTAIHPDIQVATVTCTTCGSSFDTRSTRPAIQVEVCSACHPAYTGEARVVRRSDRIERFERRRAAAGVR
jgi:large subunit ribosomal protein L31